MDDQNTQYIKAQLAAGVLPTQIVQNLVSGGWQPAQATALVQQVSGVQLASTTSPGAYTKPPIILQIMYGLSFIALLFGILAALGAVLLFSNSSNSFSGVAGLFNLGLAAYFIGIFILFRKLRNGSLGALWVYTGLVVIGVVASASAYGYFNNQLLFEGSPLIPSSPVDVLVQNLIPILIVTYLWTRHRLYFK